MRGPALITAVTVVALAATTNRALACFARQTKVALQEVSLLAGPPGPTTLRLVLASWESVAAGPGQSCGYAVKVPGGIVDSVDQVTVVEAGTAAPAPGLGTGWAASAGLAAAVTATSPPGVGDVWMGFVNTLAAPVPDDAALDVQLDVTLLPGATPGDLVAVFADRLRSKERLFAGETDAGDAPLGNPQQRLVALFGLPEPGETLNCRRAVAKEASKLVKAKAKALRKCEETKVRGEGDTLDPPFAACDVEAKAAGKIAAALSKMHAKIGKACGGDDKACGGNLQAETGGALAGLPFACPNFASGACATPIDLLACSGIADCVACIGGATVAEAIGLAYADLVPSDPVAEPALNRCQQVIGKETTAYLLAKEKALRKCWDQRLKGKHGAGCPDDTADPDLAKDARKAAEQIAKAESKKIVKICKACGGADQTCDDPVDAVNPLTPALGGAGGPNPEDADLDPAAIWTLAACPAVTVPDGPSPNRPAVACARPVATLADLVFCVDCVAELTVDCLDPARVPEAFAGVPAECNP